jgi:hypothetical protein
MGVQGVLHVYRVAAFGLPNTGIIVSIIVMCVTIITLLTHY